MGVNAKHKVEIDEVKIQTTECMTCGETFWPFADERLKPFQKTAKEMNKEGEDGEAYMQHSMKRIYAQFVYFEGNPTIDGHKVFCTPQCLDAHRVARHVANGLRRFKVTWRLSANTEITTYVWVNPKSWSDDEVWNEYGDSKEQVIQNTAANLISQTHYGISDDYLRYYETLDHTDSRFNNVYRCNIEEVNLI